MKQLLCLIPAFFLFACQPETGTDTTSADSIDLTEQTVDDSTVDQTETVSDANEPISVILKRESKCVIEHNADSEVEYLIGDKLAKNLIWNNAYFSETDAPDAQFVTLLDDRSAAHQITAFLQFDYDAQCYKIMRTEKGATTYLVGSAVQDEPQEIPETPIFDLRIQSIELFHYFDELSGYEFVFPIATVINTGNVHVNGVRIYCYVNNAIHGIGFRVAGFPIGSDPIETGGGENLLPGRDFEITFEIHDSNGEILDTYTKYFPAL